MSNTTKATYSFTLSDGTVTTRKSATPLTHVVVVTVSEAQAAKDIAYHDERIAVAAARGDVAAWDIAKKAEIKAGSVGVFSWSGSYALAQKNVDKAKKLWPSCKAEIAEVG
jgi:hypothetical protein